MEEPTVNSIKKTEITHSQQRNALEQAAEHFFLNSNDGDIFLVAAEESLECGHSRVLLEFLQDPEYRQLLDFVGWDLVKIVFRFTPNENVESDCRNILAFICSSCNPREICLSVGDLLSYSLTWQQLVTLLSLLQETCLRLVGKVAKIFSSILSCLTRCLRNRENGFDHLPEILESTLEFLRPHVEKIGKWPSSGQEPGSGGSEDINDLKEEFELFFINLLEYPVVLFDSSEISLELEPGCDQNCDKFSRFRKFADTIVEFLGCIECNSFKNLFEYGVFQRKQNARDCKSTDEESCDEERILSDVGIGCLAFLVFVENIGTRFVPVVMTGKYFLGTTLYYINQMVSHGQTKVISKGVRLLLTILGMTEPGTLDHNLLDDGEIFKMAGILTKLMTHCEEADIRQESVQALRMIMDRFENRGTYKLLRLLYQSCTHSGVAELLILILKEKIAESLHNCGKDEWFVGSCVRSFFEEIFRIPTRVLQSEHGIVEERSRILSSLNLCRFLLLRDNEDKTGIHTMLSELQRTYLRPLMDAATLSKARLKRLIKEKHDEIGGKLPRKASESEEGIISVVTPDGCKLDQASLQDQLDSLEFASLTVDMIESVLVRLGEIGEAKRKENVNLK